MTARTTVTMLAAALALALAGWAVAASPASPAPSGQGGHRPMQKLDLNQDGVVDRSEAAAHPRLAAKFDQVDKNGDGKLDATERAQMRSMQDRSGKRGHGADMHHQGLKVAIRLDADGDGRISKLEAGQSPLSERFDAIDGNRDGYLVRSELRVEAAQRRGEHRAKREQQAQARFAAADADGDGKLSRAEVEAGMPHLAKAFSFLDEDRDGFLNRADLQPTRR